MGRLLCEGALNQRAMRDQLYDLQVIGRKGRAVGDSLTDLTFFARRDLLPGQLSQSCFQ